MEKWDAIQRELPYARRFQNTLERRIETHGGVIPDQYEDGGGVALSPVFVEWRGKEVCKRCKEGERFEFLCPKEKYIENGQTRKRRMYKNCWFELNEEYINFMDLQKIKREDGVLSCFAKSFCINL